MPAQLVALNDGPSILVDKPILLLGRHPECDIQIDSRKISRRHCCIAQVHDYLVVRDLDSTNGIRINGVRVVEGRLHAGDELTVGNHRYQVTWNNDRPVAGRAVAQARPPAAGAGSRPVPLSPPSMPILDDDDALEACDEPVALPDPGRPQPRAGGPVRLPNTALHPDSVAPADQESHVIPENLELLPNSGSFPGVNERKS